MQRILVATDFSSRSDRALRRATLLAKQLPATIVAAHVVDDDQPVRLADTAQREATAMLDDLAATLQQFDGITCETRVLRGESFRGILQAAEEVAADLILVGPHRRQILCGVFTGTTVERTIRTGSRPVLMANGFPTAGYRRVLLAVDFSAVSAHAVQAARRLGLLSEDMDALALHVFTSTASDLMVGSGLSEGALAAAVAADRNRAASELHEFLREADLTSAAESVVQTRNFPGEAICEAARQQQADLIVIGTRGQGRLERLLLGSVAEEVLRCAECDVLAVPPAR